LELGSRLKIDKAILRKVLGQYAKSMF